MSRSEVLGATEKPSPLPVRWQQIPRELQQEDRWVGWNWVWKPLTGGGGKWDKPPLNVRSGNPASCSDPSTWCDFSTALAAADAGDFDGIGFVLGDLGDGRVVTGVDIDDCRDPETGELSAEATAVVEKLHAYAEVSPSCTGIKLFCYGQKPEGRCRKGNYEIYSQSRYFTVTGDALPGVPPHLTDGTEGIGWFYRNFILAAPDDLDRTERKRAIDALTALAPARADNYHDWLEVGMALHSVDPSLVSEWDRWSQQGRNYVPGECADKWASFKSEGVGLGSLIEMAKEDGWKPGKGEVTFNAISSAELANGDYSLDYLIEGVMVEGQPLILAGAKKVLKTSLMIAMAIALASGEMFLGKFKVKRPCRVAVMTGESGLATIRDTARRICTAVGVRLDELSNLIWSHQLPMFDDPAHLTGLETLLADNEIDVVFIDPAYLAMPGADAGNLMVQGRMLNAVNQACQRHGVTLVLIHHTKMRSEANKVPELHDISWAGFGEFFRQWLLVGRRELYVPGSGLHKLWLSVGGSAGHSSLWAVDIEEGQQDDADGRRWEVKVALPDEVKAAASQEKKQQRAEESEKRLKEAMKRVVETLKEHPGGLTKTAIKTNTKLGLVRAGEAISALMALGRVEACEVVTGNQVTPKPGYRLTASSALQEQ